jgi:hypothetical protein
MKWDLIDYANMVDDELFVLYFLKNKNIIDNVSFIIT